MLELSLPADSLRDYLWKQIDLQYPDGRSQEFQRSLETVFPKVLTRLEKCFSKIKSRYFKSVSGQPYFNHLHGDHYAAFLYLVSNELYKAGNESAASKAFLLNKQMFGIDAYYGIELPEVFLFVHPIGTILGNAKYSNYFVVYQGVTIGSKTDGVYPEFSEKTILYSNTSVIGHCKLGENAVVAAKASLVDVTVDANHVILGQYPNNRQVENRNNLIEDYFEV